MLTEPCDPWPGRLVKEQARADADSAERPVRSMSPIWDNAAVR